MPSTSTERAAYCGAVWDVLVASCGAAEAGWADFVSQATLLRGRMLEYRFQGELGSGGKVHMEDPPRVSCYSDDENPRRQRAVEDANALLRKLPRPRGM